MVPILIDKDAFEPSYNDLNKHNLKPQLHLHQSNKRNEMSNSELLCLLDSNERVSFAKLMNLKGDLYWEPGY